MQASPGRFSEMRLYNDARQRLYINAEERERFAVAAAEAAPEVRAFCLTLLFTGCRISEALSLTRSSVQLDAQTIAFETLKRRRSGVFREVPVPEHLITTYRQDTDLFGPNADSLLWAQDGHPLHRVTGYRWVKSVMAEAGIHGAQACPKGLRHGYGIHAIRSGVPVTLPQKWLGHASLSTTAIYTNALGADELHIARRMWR